jgi:hypothetical protein
MSRGRTNSRQIKLTSGVTGSRWIDHHPRHAHLSLPAHHHLPTRHSATSKLRIDCFHNNTYSHTGDFFAVVSLFYYQKVFCKIVCDWISISFRDPSNTKQICLVLSYESSRHQIARFKATEELRPAYRAALSHQYSQFLGILESKLLNDVRKYEISVR